MRESSSTSFLPWKRGSRVSSSAKMQPRDHMSTSKEYDLVPSRSSGARYHNVTTSWVRFGGGGEDVKRAMPKSASLTSPRLFKRMLDVLRSRWRMYWECRYDVADVSWSINVLISEGRKGSERDSSRDFRSCSMKERTRYTLFIRR